MNGQEPGDDDAPLGDPSDIKTAIAWDNGSVMVFDSAGLQVLEYEGWLSENCERILLNAREDVELFMGVWGEANSLIPLPIEAFRLLAEAEAIPDGRH